MWIQTSRLIRVIQPDILVSNYLAKQIVRWIVVQRLPNTTGDGSSLFTMTFGLKEKKQKSMRTPSVV